MVTSGVELGAHEGTQLGPSETSNGPSKYPPLASFGVMIVKKSGEDGPERPTSSTYSIRVHRVQDVAGFEPRAR